MKRIQAVLGAMLLVVAGAHAGESRLDVLYEKVLNANGSSEDMCNHQLTTLLESEQRVCLSMGGELEYLERDANCFYGINLWVGRTQVACIRPF